MTMNPRPKRWPAGGRRWRRAVVATYAQTGSLEAAATAAGTSRRTVCRARDEDPGFAAELEEAMEIYADALEAECDRRAFSGTPRPVFQGGKRVGETIAVMNAFAGKNGFQFDGRHHEIYLSDPRRVPPEKLKTILRHPVRKSRA